MSDRFTADKMAWLERVQDDPAVSAAAFSVAFAIARHLNRKTGDAWPGQATLGAMAGVGERQVRNLLKQLTEAGHIEVTAGGFQRPDRYRLAASDRQPIAAIIPEKDCRSGDAPDRKSSVSETGNGFPPNPLKEPSESPNPEKPVCGSATHTEFFQDEDEALAFVRGLITKANVEADPRKVLLACQSHHGDAWRAKLKTWTLGAIARSTEKPKPISPTYDGPAELRADALKVGGDRLAGYFDHYVRWREEDRTLMCRSPAIADTIVKAMGEPWLARREINIGLLVANDVAARPEKRGVVA